MRELNVDVGFETKKNESGKDTDVAFGRLYISLDKSSSASLLLSVIHFSIFFRSHLPLP